MTYYATSLWCINGLKLSLPIHMALKHYHWRWQENVFSEDAIQKTFKKLARNTVKKHSGRRLKTHQKHIASHEVSNCWELVLTELRLGGGWFGVYLFDTFNGTTMISLTVSGFTCITENNPGFFRVVWATSSGFLPGAAQNRPNSATVGSDIPISTMTAMTVTTVNSPPSHPE